MHIYNKIHVLLSALSYIFRRLLRHLQGELYRVLKTITLFNYRSKAILYMALQLYIQSFKKYVCFNVRLKMEKENNCI
jgi:hypothetical protein